MLDPQIGIDVAHDLGPHAVVVAGWAQHPRYGTVIAARLHLFDGTMELRSSMRAPLLL